MLGYVLYSAYSHVFERRRPTGSAAIVVALASLLPDLIDKPLAWQFELLPTGRSLAHSLFFAIPAILVVVLVARRYRASDVGAAFAIGYLSHLPADSVYAFVIPGVRVDLGYLIWPLASAGSTQTADLFGQVLYLVANFSAFVSGPSGWRFLLIEGLLGLMALGLWILDGRPGLGTIARVFGRVRHA